MESLTWRPHFNKLEVWVIRTDSELFAPEHYSKLLGRFEDMSRCVAAAPTGAAVRFFWADAVIDREIVSCGNMHFGWRTQTEQDLASLCLRIKTSIQEWGGAHMVPPSRDLPGMLMISFLVQLQQDAKQTLGVLFDSHGSELRFMSSRSLFHASQTDAAVFIFDGHLGLSSTMKEDLNSIFASQLVPLLPVSVAPTHQVPLVYFVFLRSQADVGRLKAAIVDLEQLGPDAYRELVAVAEASWFTLWERHSSHFGIAACEGPPPVLHLQLDDALEPAAGRKGAVRAVKQLQRDDPVGHAEWYAYCAVHCAGIRDPCRHSLPSLQKFLTDYHRGHRIESLGQNAAEFPAGPYQIPPPLGRGAMALVGASGAASVAVVGAMRPEGVAPVSVENLRSAFQQSSGSRSGWGLNTDQPSMPYPLSAHNFQDPQVMGRRGVDAVNHSEALPERPHAFSPAPQIFYGPSTQTVSGLRSMGLHGNMSSAHSFDPRFQSRMSNVQSFDPYQAGVELPSASSTLASGRDAQVPSATEVPIPCMKKHLERSGLESQFNSASLPARRGPSKQSRAHGIQ